jgi:cystathionine beta-lyase/cystathionine gamma-synthase
MAKLFKYYDGELERVWYDSSNVKYSEIDDKENSLKTVRVVFNNGSQYRYDDVDVYDYLKFRDAESTGKAFNQYLKKYTYEKLENADLEKLDMDYAELKGGAYVFDFSSDNFTIRRNDGHAILTYDRKLKDDEPEVVEAVIKALKIPYKKE